jgi:regulation of enolase protein 1 (concanavalin A-like superfamily)
VDDPDGDCAVEQLPEGVRITVPGVQHNLNPQYGSVNAPRVLREVEGDFRAVVRVTSDFHPELPSTGRNAHAFNGAGLVLWVDDRSFLRLERNVWVLPNGVRNCFPPLFEAFDNGRATNSNPTFAPASVFRGDSTALYLERRGDLVRGAYSHDSRNWEGWREVRLPCPRKLRIGIDAVNTSAKPLTVTYDGFNVTTE